MKRHAFTLVELLVSIALVLILIVGVNQVFKLTSDTIGASNGLSDAIRMNRAVQSSMFDDIRKSVLPGAELSRGGPFLLIDSSRIAAFPNATEELNDRDYVRDTNPTVTTVDRNIRTIDVDGDNAEGGAGEVLPVTNLDSRNHRVDVFSLFARDLYRRQTGNDAATGTPEVYVADQTSTEAWVWYGHLRQPTQDSDTNSGRPPGYTRTTINGTFTTLNAENNKNNFYAQQWILGRFATLLVEPELIGNNRYIYRYDSGGNRQEAQMYIGRAEVPPSNPPVTVTRLSPLSAGSQNTNDGTFSVTAPPRRGIEQGRYDLAGIGIHRYADAMRSAIFAEATNGTGPFDLVWWDANSVNYRFYGFPYPTKPMSPAGAARTVPCFVPACTQFAVEFAGDFITQRRGDLNFDGVIDARDRDDSRYGAAIMARPDGVIDFIVEKKNNTLPSERIRWYGFPRNVYTDDDRADRPVIRSTPLNGDLMSLRDVIPLRDILAVCPRPPIPPGPETPTSPTPPRTWWNANGTERFERVLPPKAAEDYADPNEANALANAHYVVAWGPAGSYFEPDDTYSKEMARPDRIPADTDTAPDVMEDPPLPKMLRLVVGVDDTEGRMSATQFYEYVIELP